MRSDGARALSRRAFLRSGLLAAAALTACRVGPERRPADHEVSVFPGGMDLVAGEEQRFTFLVVDPEDPRASGRWTGDVSFVGPDGGVFSFEAPRWRSFARTGEGEPVGYNEMTVRNLPAGLVDVIVSEPMPEGLPRRSGSATVMVLAEPEAPAVGSSPVKLATPTLDRPRGYEQVCTRNPVCGLHARSLDDVLGKVPAMVIVGSPLLCESRTCGPVLDEVLAVHRERPNLTTIHVEPYTELTTVALAPIMTAWGLPSEPWVFMFDADGKVRARFEGPVNAAELSAALRKLR